MRIHQYYRCFILPVRVKTLTPRTHYRWFEYNQLSSMVILPVSIKVARSIERDRSTAYSIPRFIVSNMGRTRHQAFPDAQHARSADENADCWQGDCFAPPTPNRLAPRSPTIVVTGMPQVAHRPTNRLDRERVIAAFETGVVAARAENLG
jgi:hypothetical protein